MPSYFLWKVTIKNKKISDNSIDQRITAAAVRIANPTNFKNDLIQVVYCAKTR